MSETTGRFVLRLVGRRRMGFSGIACDASPNHRVFEGLVGELSWKGLVKDACQTRSPQSERSTQVGRA